MQWWEATQPSVAVQDRVTGGALLARAGECTTTAAERLGETPGASGMPANCTSTAHSGFSAAATHL